MQHDLSQIKAANWHLFQEGGLSLLFDSRTLSLNILDEVAWEVARVFDFQDREYIIKSLSSRFHPGEVEAAYEEIEGLIDSGVVSDFRAGDHELFPAELLPSCSRSTQPVKALCLNVTHDCNLRCKYCFAGSGTFGGAREVMSKEIARRALDFLLEASGARKHCEVDFFGGEPLINWSTVEDAVSYGFERARNTGKIIKFTITTNATLLDDEKIDFIRRNNMDVVLSLDGRPETNDRMRVFAGGRPTYDIVSHSIRRFIQCGNGGIYYVRGTYTRFNLDFSDDVMHLADLGARSVSVEPVVAPDEAPYSLRREDLPVISREYSRLASKFIDRTRAGKGFSFFHFNLELDRGPCVARRFSGCGAGSEYLAVDPSGNLYPCHQFVGKSAFMMGDVWKGVARPEVSEEFKRATIYTKEGCAECWARFLCGGGCHAGAWDKHNSILSPDGIACEIMRRRLECALYVRAALSM